MGLFENLAGGFSVAISVSNLFYCAIGAILGLSGAAFVALVGSLLAGRRGKLARARVYPPERDVSGEEVRIGVFVCSCGINIAGVIDVAAVRDYAATLPYVAYVENNLFTCSQDTQEIIKELGTNGGGFFNANSSHPYENPTPLTNLIEMLAIFIIGAGLTHTFGQMAGDLLGGQVDAHVGWAVGG